MFNLCNVNDSSNDAQAACSPKYHHLLGLRPVRVDGLHPRLPPDSPDPLDSGGKEVGPQATPGRMKNIGLRTPIGGWWSDKTWSSDQWSSDQWSSDQWSSDNWFDNWPLDKWPDKDSDMKTNKQSCLATNVFLSLTFDIH